MRNSPYLDRPLRRVDQTPDDAAVPPGSLGVAPATAPGSRPGQGFPPVADNSLAGSRSPAGAEVRDGDSARPMIFIKRSPYPHCGCSKLAWVRCRRSECLAAIDRQMLIKERVGDALLSLTLASAVLLFAWSRGWLGWAGLP